jgi:hypothetical protein
MTWYAQAKIDQTGVAQHLPIFSMIYELRNITNNILGKHRLKRCLYNFRQWKYTRKNVVTTPIDLQPNWLKRKSISLISISILDYDFTVYLNISSLGFICYQREKANTNVRESK